MDEIRAHLDAIEGTQLAMLDAVRLLLTPYRGNAEAIAALEHQVEISRARLLHSQSTDLKLSAFHDASESLLAAVRKVPP